MSDKVILRDHRATVKVLLPSTGITVEVYSSLLISEMDALDVEGLAKGSVGQAKFMFVKLIKSWNAYDSEESPEPLPINAETVGLIHAEDVPVLTEAIEKLNKEQKKS